MTRRTAFALHTTDTQTGMPTSLVLRATEDGWSLLAPDGAVVFSALGVRARHECLAYARDHGSLSVIQR
jgi:hypothetical protein